MEYTIETCFFFGVEGVVVVVKNPPSNLLKKHLSIRKVFKSVYVCVVCLRLVLTGIFWA